MSPHTKLDPNQMKTTEVPTTGVENFHFLSILVGWAGRSKNGRNHLKHSESVQNLNKIGQKLAKLAHHEFFSQN